MKSSAQGKKKGKKLNSRVSRWLYMLFIIVCFSLSSGLSYMYLKEKFAFESTFIADMELKHSARAGKEKTEDNGRLYGDPGDGKVLRKDTTLVVVEDAIRKTVRPYGVRLLDLYFDKEGTIYADFGGEIKKNFKGDAFDELRIVSGLYKSIKNTLPGFSYLKILVDGKETETIGGHINISRPIGEEVAGNF